VPAGPTSYEQCSTHLATSSGLDDSAGSMARAHGDRAASSHDSAGSAIARSMTAQHGRQRPKAAESGRERPRTADNGRQRPTTAEKLALDVAKGACRQDAAVHLPGVANAGPDVLSRLSMPESSGETPAYLHAVKRVCPPRRDDSYLYCHQPRPDVRRFASGHLGRTRCSVRELMVLWTERKNCALLETSKQRLQHLRVLAVQQ